MFTEFLTILAIPVLSLGIGYFYGRNDVDSNTVEGKEYYAPRHNENQGWKF